jgi:peptide/nickel transport system substrate-binding protein
MRVFSAILVAGTIALSGVFTPAGAQTLRVAMTTSDLPTTGGIPDNGSEGGRFAGYTIYDALVNWDFSNTGKPAGLTPGLATEWHVDPNDNKTWIFTLRQGVKYHDGSAFVADDVIWNLDRLLNKSAPNYDKAQASSYSNYTAIIDKYYKIDDTHIGLHTSVPFSPLPYDVARIFIVSPTQFKNDGSDWLAFNNNPSGTGPFKVTKITPHVSIELARNENYWDTKRIPKVKTMILYPVPDANTRVAALRSGQVDWIEYPAPDSVASLKAAGFQIVTKSYPHLWGFLFNNGPGSPLNDIRVRQALNYAVDRDGLAGELLAGTAIPADGYYLHDDTAHFGGPTQAYIYDPDKAKALLKAAGYGPDHHLKLEVQIPTAGSGNMVPLPMGEYIQENLRDVWVDIDYQVVDWGTMQTTGRTPADSPGTPHLDALAHGLPAGIDPSSIYNSFMSTTSAGIPNWSHFSDPAVDKLLTQAFATFDSTQSDALIAQAHAKIVDDAAWLFVVHDLNPRALSPKVKGYVQVESWYQDFTQLTVDP